MRAALARVSRRSRDVSDVLEEPRPASTAIVCGCGSRMRDGSARFDYTGTIAAGRRPLNAVFGVTLSGVYYALRAVTDPTIPMNEGFFRPIEMFVPEGTLLNPRRPAPVSGGNVET